MNWTRRTIVSTMLDTECYCKRLTSHTRRETVITLDTILLAS